MPTSRTNLSRSSEAVRNAAHVDGEVAIKSLLLLPVSGDDTTMRTRFNTKPEVNPVAYSEQLREAWIQMISANRTLGFTVVASRIDLPPDRWQKLILEDIPFDLKLACRVLKLIQDQQVGCAGLTGTYNLSEIIQLTETTFRWGVDRGLVSARCSPEELASLKKKFKDDLRAESSH